MKKVNPRLPEGQNGNYFASVAGAGSAIALLCLAGKLPDHQTIKTWLIFVTPVLTLVIKYCWAHYVTGVFWQIGNRKKAKVRRKLLRKIELQLEWPFLRDQEKSMLLRLREDTVRNEIAALQQTYDRFIDN